MGGSFWAYVVVFVGGFLVECGDQLEIVFDLDDVSRKLISSKAKFIVSWILGSVKLNCEQKILSAFSPWVQSIKISSIYRRYRIGF